MVIEVILKMHMSWFSEKIKYYNLKFQNWVFDFLRCMHYSSQKFE